jgi:hypothetical protein
MKVTAVLSVVLFLSLSIPVFAQAPNSKEMPPAASPKLKIFSITGKFTMSMGTYYLRQEKPPERYAIMNPNRKLLDELIKNGKTVTIEVVSIVGDNVKIEKIDGVPYKEALSSKDRNK